MPETVANEAPTLRAPSFYLTVRQPLRPGAIVLAIVVAAGALSSVLFALGRSGQAHLGQGNSGATHSANTTGEEKDDPDQIDTIVLGDPTDAPVPGRRGDHVSPVHPTIIVHLPRFGEQVGLIPDSPGGHLLYEWLAAFNQASEERLQQALPNVAVDAAVALQMELRQETGGFRLISAKEVEPGVMVFRLQDQTPAGGEVLGTLQVVAGSNAAAIASFSLRGVARVRAAAGAGTDADSLRE